RRSGGATVALDAAAGLPLVADRDPAPLQRQVPARLAAALPLLRVRPAAAPGRAGRAGGGAVPRSAGHRPAGAAARRSAATGRRGSPAPDRPRRATPPPSTRPTRLGPRLL